MPQMMPLNWMMLFIYFIMIFILFNMMMYFNYSIDSINKNMKTYKININWKW